MCSNSWKSVYPDSIKLKYMYHGVKNKHRQFLICSPPKLGLHLTKTQPTSRYLCSHTLLQKRKKIMDSEYFMLELSLKVTTCNSFSCIDFVLLNPSRTYPVLNMVFGRGSTIWPGFALKVFELLPARQKGRLNFLPS